MWPFIHEISRHTSCEQESERNGRGGEAGVVA